MPDRPDAGALARFYADLLGWTVAKAAVEDALAAGARLGDHQPQENLRVMLDPAGGPFCFYRPP